MDITNIIEEDNFLKLKQYIKNGGDVNCDIEGEGSLLFFALRKKCSYELIEFLIESGADIGYYDSYGVGIFDEAIDLGDINLIKYLIYEKRVDINKTNRDSKLTPLMLASCYGLLNVVKLLVENGADINARDKLGLSAKDYSRKMLQKNVLEYLDKIEWII